jgi:hypothetical protein
MTDYPCSAIAFLLFASAWAERQVVGRYEMGRLRSLARRLKCSQTSVVTVRADATAGGARSAVQQVPERVWTLGAKPPKVVLQDLKKSGICIIAVVV